MSVDNARPVIVDRRTSSSPAATRTTAILDEVRKSLDERRSLFDAAKDLGSVCIEVRLHAGTTIIKSVVITDERINRRLPYRQT